MRVTVSRDLIVGIVEEIGGTFTERGADGVASFGDPNGWQRECIFALGQPGTILVGEPVTLDMRYHGSGNRLNPAEQEKRKKAAQSLRRYPLACQAMLTHSTGMHGKSASEVMGEMREGYSEMRETRKKLGFKEETPPPFALHRLNRGWAVLESIMQAFPNRPIRELDSLLIHNGAIYIPLAES